MTEMPLPLPDDPETDAVEPASSVSVDIVARGLPYILEGQVPTEPDAFELVARVPDGAWEEISPQVERELSENDWFARQYRRLQQTVRLGDGRVGSVWISPRSSPDGAPTIHVDRIQTELGYMPEGSAYHAAKGVGSMILDSLCAIADARGWRITLHPLERDGRLMGMELQDWYRRRGFKFKFEEEDGELKGRYPSDDMLRFPEAPDPSLPVVQALEQ